MGIWKVYCYTGQNGKKYIGITSRSLAERAGKDGYCYKQEKNSKFSNVINKYGFDFFTAEILIDELEEDEAKMLEKYYIDYYDSFYNGYNSTLGGDGSQKADYKEILQLWKEGNKIEKIKQKTGYGKRAISATLNAYGVGGTERIRRSAGQYHSIEIYCYDLEGQYVTSYPTISEAGRILQGDHSNIVACLKGKRPSAYGFQWSYEKKENIGPIKKNGFKKTVYQYSLEKILIREYESAAQAARETGFGVEYIRRQAKIQGKAYGYIWSYNKLDV